MDLEIKYVDDPCPTCGGWRGTKADHRALRRIREAAGWSLRRLARALKVAPGTVSAVELGKRRASPEMVAGYRELAQIVKEESDNAQD